ncbi:MAG: hypothetical protein ACT4QC_03505 [Planctomycetaceae bacterium]
MPTWGLLLFRLCLAAWVGVCCFFLATVIGLRRSELFTEEVMLNHPRVLFPLYYAFQFGLLGGALACAWLARGHVETRRASFRWAVTLTASALLIAFVDYALVYRPLAAMILQAPLPPSFSTYHHASRWINTGTTALCAVAAALAVWPGRPRAG